MLLSNTQLKGVSKGLTKGFINAYVCPDLHSVITKNLDNGFIPEKVVCPKCDQEAYTMMYYVNQGFTPVVEFFKPTESEMQSAELSMSKEVAASHREYISKGGLLTREVKKLTLKKV